MESDVIEDLQSGWGIAHRCFLVGSLGVLPGTGATSGLPAGVDVSRRSDAVGFGSGR